MRYLFFFLLILGGFSLRAQGPSMPLPVVKNGKWLLIRGSEEIPLPVSYTHVGLFDQEGTACFARSNRYGILRRDGKEIIPADFFSIVPLDHGYYRCTSAKGTEILSISGETRESIPCDTAIVLQPSWIYLERDTTRFLLNLPSKKLLPLQEREAVIREIFDYLVVVADSLTLRLLDPLGRIVSENDSSYYSMRGTVFQYEAPGLYLLIDEKGEIPVPKGAKNVSIMGEYLHYSLNGTVYLTNRETRRPVISVKGEWIYPFSDNYYMFVRNDRQGLMTRTGTIVLQPEYSYIYDDGTYYNVTRQGMTGLLDRQFRTVVPCRYTYITYDRQFFYPCSEITGKGMISRLTGQELLSPVFDRIVADKLMVKAWSGSKLSILELTEDHRVKNRLVLDNTVSLYRRVRSATDPMIDRRLFALGWYYDTTSVLDSTGTWLRTNYLWGLKNGNDSLLIAPRFLQPVYLPGAPVSLISAGTERIGTFGSGSDAFRIFRMVNFSTGKTDMKVKIVDFDSTDFSFRNYARYARTNGEGLLRRDGSSENVAFIDRSEDELLRVCYSGEQTLTEKPDEECVDIYTPGFNGDSYIVPVTRNNKTYTKQKYLNARWNFLDKDGNPLFKTDFSFVQPFYHGAAIVKSSSGWGVARRDSLVIPVKYSAISRVKELGDTVFRVKLTSGRKLYFDTAFREIPVQIERIDKIRGDLSLCFHNGAYRVLGKNHKVLAEDTKPFYLYDFNRFASKSKKVFTLYDENGRAVGESGIKPEEFLDEDHFTCESNGKTGLLSINGDTLIPFEYGRILLENERFLAQGKSGSALYTTNGTLIRKAENMKILSDPVSGGWAEVAEDKITLYDRDGMKTGKLKSDLKFLWYFNGHLFSEAANFTILAADGTEVLAGKKFSEVQFFSYGYCALKNDDNKWELYGPDWKEEATDLVEKRKIRSLGEDVLAIQLKDGTALFDCRDGQIYPGFAKVSGDWQDGFLLVATGRRTLRWHYLNRRFENEFDRNFSYARPFSNGYACVADVTGWTLLNAGGLPVSLPSYGELESAGHRIFRMTALPTYGLVDSYGKTILEAVYEKITVLPGNLIQVIRDGKIGYFDYAGKVIYLLGD